MISCFQVLVLLGCIGVTALNQYITYNSSKVWLAGDRYTKNELDRTRMVAQAQAQNAALVAKANDIFQQLMSLADSERQRSEKAEYDLARTTDKARVLLAYIEHITTLAKDKGVTIPTIQEYLENKPTEAEKKPE